MTAMTIEGFEERMVSEMRRQFDDAPECCMPYMTGRTLSGDHVLRSDGVTGAPAKDDCDPTVNRWINIKWDSIPEEALGLKNECLMSAVLRNVTWSMDIDEYGTVVRHRVQITDAEALEEVLADDLRMHAEHERKREERKRKREE